MSLAGDVGAERQGVVRRGPCRSMNTQLCDGRHTAAGITPSRASHRWGGRPHASAGAAAGALLHLSGTSFGTKPIQPTMPSALTMAAATKASS